tara:strand:+ start:3638 stop:4147 length:510 start_codon:yes stop_codon:yes gene_type:complete
VNKMIETRGLLYADSRLRDILHVPDNFIVIQSRKGETEVILDLVCLRRRTALLKRKRDWESIERGWGGIVHIDNRDLETVTELIFSNRIKEAEEYCLDIFDQKYNEVYKKTSLKSCNEYESLDFGNSFDDFNGYVGDKEDSDDYWWLQGKEPKFDCSIYPLELGDEDGD